MHVKVVHPINKLQYSEDDIKQWLGVVPTPAVQEEEGAMGFQAAVA